MHRWGSRLQGSQFRSLLPNTAKEESYEADCECLQDPKHSNQTENHSWNLKRNFITLEIQIQYGQYGISIYPLLYIHCHRLLQNKRKQSVWNYQKSKQKKPELPSHSTLRHGLRLHGSPQYPVEMTMTCFLCYRNACSQFRRLSAAAFFSSCWTFPGIENCWLMPHRSTCFTAAMLPMKVYVCNMLSWVHVWLFQERLFQDRQIYVWLFQDRQMVFKFREKVSPNLQDKIEYVEEKVWENKVQCPVISFHWEATGRFCNLHV